jgi:hypothetical protein
VRCRLSRLALLVEYGDVALLAEIYRDENAARARAIKLSDALLELNRCGNFAATFYPVWLRFSAVRCSRLL